MSHGNGWIGVDLDGTLAQYTGWNGPEHIGAPIAPMVARVKVWIAAGIKVKIFTARVGGTCKNNDHARKFIHSWCLTHLGSELEVTATKDYGMIQLWDDRAVQVVMNTGKPVFELVPEQVALANGLINSLTVS